MSQAANPRNIDVRRYFSQQREYRASFRLSLFPRLQALLSEDNDDTKVITVDLQFEKNPQGECFISGNIEAELTLICQRCLGDLPHQLHTQLAVQVVEELQTAGDRELDADELEVVLSEHGRLDLLSLIEDEVILSLPIVSFHEDAACSQDLQAFREAAQNKAPAKESSPFASLEGLKKQLQAEKQKLESTAGKASRTSKRK